MVEELIPSRTTVVLAHAVVDAIATEVGADILHIKGPAVGADVWGPGGSAAPSRRTSVDADVLVRPRHVSRLLEGMERHGWSVLFDFRGGSPFEHASTLTRPDVANVDLHRYFPGIELEPEQAFQQLWVERRTAVLAGRSVHVPSAPAQRLILILHAARNARGAESPDTLQVWTHASREERAEVTALAERLSARVALAAGTGRLHSVRGERSHDLWCALSRGERSQVVLWRARVRAAPSRREALRVGIRLLAPNTHRLAARTGHPLTGRELLAAYLVQISRGLRALTRGSAARHRGNRESGTR